MSETPQETLTTYLHRGYIKGTLGPGEVREAIRAVLDLVRVQYEANEEMTRLLTDAQADVSQMEGVARGYMLAAEKAEAERDALRAEVERLREELALECELVNLQAGDAFRAERLELVREVERLQDLASDAGIRCGIESLKGKP